MIQTTNNMREFMEEYATPIFIYGAGNPGGWVAYYMARCNTSIEGFLDKACKVSIDCDVKVKGIRVYHPSALQKYIGKKIRVVVAVQDVNSALADLHYFGQCNEILCMVPILKDFFSDKLIYDINGMLSYFRSKLINVSVPTIISNKCNAGIMYHILGLPMMSPTINTGMSNEDFIKLCRNPRFYFEQQMFFDGYMVARGECFLAARVADITIALQHDKDIQDAIKRWDLLRKRVDYNNLVYVMSDDKDYIMQKEQREFLALNGKKLLVISNSYYEGVQTKDKSILHVSTDCFLQRNSVCENYFDLLGWINGEV